MTKEARSPNDEYFWLRHSTFFRHWCLVIRHSLPSEARALPCNCPCSSSSKRAQMPVEVLFQHLGVNLFVAAQGREERCTKRGVVQDRAKSYMQNLAAVETVEQRCQLVVWNRNGIGHLG